MSSERGPLAALIELAPQYGRSWLVGGAVRDGLLGRETPDLDLAVDGDARSLARELGRRAGGHAFELSDVFGAWRVRAHDQNWQVDLTPLMGETLEQDLRRRDLTINAIACELDAPPGELIDPLGGVADLEARRLRSTGPDAFSADPLRVLRLARLAAELDFTAEKTTRRQAAACAPGLAKIAQERVFTELRLMLASRRAAEGIEFATALGATAAMLPELEALRGVEQSEYHHLDVYDHTIATLRAAIELERDPAATFGDELGDHVSRVMSEQLANEMTRWQALRLGTLLHDIAKSRTRAVADNGRVTFFEHDRLGAQLTSEILARLRASERLRSHVAGLARHHLRLGFLVHERPLTRRAVYDYMAASEPVEVDVTVLSVADRLATLGRNSERAVKLHVETSREILRDALAWHEHRPRPPIAGDELAAALGIEQGPQLGRLLAELTAASYAGELETREQLLAHSRDWLAHDSAELSHDMERDR